MARQASSLRWASLLRTLAIILVLTIGYVMVLHARN